jgi:hypothetical protein
MNANERHLGYLCRDILTTFVKVKRLEKFKVRLLVPLTDGVPDACHPDLKNEPAPRIAHFTEAIQLRIKNLKGVLGTAHWVVKSSPVWSVLFEYMAAANLLDGTVDMRKIGVRGRKKGGTGLNAVFSMFSFEVVKQKGSNKYLVKNKHPSSQWTSENEFTFETCGLAFILKFVTHQGMLYNTLGPVVTEHIRSFDGSRSQILRGLRESRPKVLGLMTEILNEGLEL